MYSSFYPLAMYVLACPRIDTQGRFRWVEIWLGVFFPRNSDVVRRETNANELLNSLKGFKTLESLPRDQNDDFRDDKMKMALMDAYEKLWAINGDGGRDKDLQIRLFHIITASFASLTPSMLLEAVSFDSKSPDQYKKLEHDHLERLYSSFLKVNHQGRLEYEHLSAKRSVEEISDSNEAVFSSAESHRTLAGIGICALELSHRVWSNAGIDLVGLGANPGDSLRIILDSKRASWITHEEVIGRNTEPDRFGHYLDRFWIRHCQQLNRDEQIIQRMSDLFQRAHPALEGWIISKAQADAQLFPLDNGICYRNSLIRVAGQDGEEVRLSPFLCMVSFGFSPISRLTDSPTLLPGFKDAIIRNLDTKTPLHIACQGSNIQVVEDLLELELSRQGSCLALLTMEDYGGQIPLHNALNDKSAKILLQYEMKEPSNTLIVCGSRTSRMLHWKNKRDHTPFEVSICYFCSEDLILWILDEF